jgi:hypothetical protein
MSTPPRMLKKIRFFPRNSYFARAYPAIAETRVDRIPPTPA